MVNQRPEVAPADDSRAYAEELREAARRADADLRAGRAYRLSEATLLALIDRAEAVRQAGKAFSREELARLMDEAVKAGEAERVVGVAGADGPAG